MQIQNFAADIQSGSTDDGLTHTKLLAFAFARADLLVEIDADATIIAVHGPSKSVLGEESASYAGQPLRSILRPGTESECAEIAVTCRGGRRLPERLMTLHSGRPATWAGFCTPDLPGRMYLSVALVERRKHPR